MIMLIELPVTLDTLVERRVLTSLPDSSSIAINEMTIKAANQIIMVITVH